MKSSRPKPEVTLPCTWFGPSNHKLKEKATVSAVRQPPNPKMAKTKVDQRRLVSRDGGDGYLKQMEALEVVKVKDSIIYLFPILTILA